MGKTKKITVRQKGKASLESEFGLIPAAAKMKIHTVLLNGEHALLRSFLRAWLSRFNHLRVVAESSNAKQAFGLVQRHRPSLVLMDFDTLQGPSLDLLAKIRTAFPKIKVIIYFAASDDNFAIKVIRAGASGFVLKSAESDDMERAIKTVMSGGVYLSPGFLKSLGTAVSREGVSDLLGRALSPRQAEILRMLASGLSTKAMAFDLKISAKTVDVHKQALMKRLGVKNAIGLFKYALQSGLVPA